MRQCFPWTLGDTNVFDGAGAAKFCFRVLTISMRQTELILRKRGEGFAVWQVVDSLGLLVGSGGGIWS